MEGVSLLSVKLSVLKELSHFGGELQSERFPRLFQFQKSGLFWNRGNFNLAGFHFCPKIHPIFGVQPFWAQFKPREFWNKGSFTFIQNLFLFLEFQKSEVFQNRGNFTLGEFHSSRWNYLYSRSWVRWGSFIQTPPPRIPDFWNSWIREYFRTAGMSRRGSFITLGETVCTQVAESIWRRVTGLKNPRGYQIPKIRTILESREF